MVRFYFLGFKGVILICWLRKEKTFCIILATFTEPAAILTCREIRRKLSAFRSGFRSWFFLWIFIILNVIIFITDDWKVWNSFRRKFKRRKRTP